LEYFEFILTARGLDSADALGGDREMDVELEQRRNPP
jgi:hypothetical protein